MKPNQLDFLFITVEILPLHAGRWFIFILIPTHFLFNCEKPDLCVYNSEQYKTSNTKSNRFAGVMSAATVATDHATIWLTVTTEWYMYK